MPEGEADLVAFNVKPHHLVVTLDLRYEMDWQLPVLKALFTAAQKNSAADGLFKRVKARERADKYVTYLRVLDAYAAGEKPAEICKVLGKKAEVKTQPRKRSQPTPHSPTSKDIGVWRKEALRLRDEGFKALAAMACSAQKPPASNTNPSAK